MSANPIRGEQRIMLDAEYIMRPSYAALQAIEDQTGLSVTELALAAAKRTLKSRHIEIIVTECVKAELRASGKIVNDAHWKLDRVGELLVEGEGGLLAVGTKLINFLGQAATGGYTAKGEAKAVPAGPTEDTPAAA